MDDKIDPVIVLTKLKDISKNHLNLNPWIGVDSLALALNTNIGLLMPLLEELRSRQEIVIHTPPAIFNTRKSRNNSMHIKVCLT